MAFKDRFLSLVSHKWICLGIYSLGGLVVYRCMSLQCEVCRGTFVSWVDCKWMNIQACLALSWGANI